MYQTHNLVQDLAQYANQLVVDKLTTLQARILQPLDLLLDDDFEGLGPDEDSRSEALKTRTFMSGPQAWRLLKTYGRDVENRPNIAILDLVEGVYGLNAIVK